MKADIRWLDDPQVFRVNRLDAHSDHKFYENKEDYEKMERESIRLSEGKLQEEKVFRKGSRDICMDQCRSKDDVQ